jgi:hypothetical protein
LSLSCYSVFHHLWEVHPGPLEEMMVKGLDQLRRLPDGLSINPLAAEPWRGLGRSQGKHLVGLRRAAT